MSQIENNIFPFEKFKVYWVENELLLVCNIKILKVKTSPNKHR